jgi:ketosteroid isomerase-like protein
MQKSLRLFAAAALIASGIWGWRVLFPGPEKVIRSRMVELAGTASFKPKDGTIRKALKAQNLQEYFTSDGVVVLDVRGVGARTLNGREEIHELAVYAMQSLRGLAVEFLDINVTLGPDKLTAIANLTAKATVAGERDFYVQEFNFMLRKMDGKWLIYRVESVKTLS